MIQELQIRHTHHAPCARTLLQCALVQIGNSSNRCPTAGNTKDPHHLRVVMTDLLKGIFLMVNATMRSHTENTQPDKRWTAKQLE